MNGTDEEEAPESNSCVELFMGKESNNELGPDQVQMSQDEITQNLLDIP